MDGWTPHARNGRTGAATASRSGSGAGALVGGCGMSNRIGPGGLEIGYRLHRTHTGQAGEDVEWRMLTP